MVFWFSSFAAVFLMGFQSRNVNSGRFAAAALTSLCIAATQLVAVRGIASGDPLTVLLITGTAGPAAITSSMLVSRWLFGRKREG